ncbi:MAG TPA: hypothetical protein VH420_09880 [Gaiellaceae bacterium]
MRALVLILAVALLLVPGSRASRETSHCGPFLLVQLPSLGTLSWRTVTQGQTIRHGLEYRPTPSAATTDVRLVVDGEVVAKRRVDEQTARFSPVRARRQVVKLSQHTEPGTLRASIEIDFKPGVTYTYCYPYLPPGLTITLLPRS